MRSLRVTAPDGSNWVVRSSRVRIPGWRTQDAFFDEMTVNDDLFSVAFSLLVFPFTHILAPLAIFLVELPLAVARGIGSSERWVEASSYFPTEQRIVWRAAREDAPAVAADVAAQLDAGELPRPPRAELVEQTP